MDVKEWSPGDRESFTTPGGPFQAPRGEQARSYSFTRGGSGAGPVTLRPASQREEGLSELKPEPWYAETQRQAAEEAKPVMVSHDGESQSGQGSVQAQSLGPQVYTVQLPRQSEVPAAPAPQKRLWWAPLLLLCSLLLGLLIGALLYPSLSKAPNSANPGQAAPEGGESAGARIYREQVDAVVGIQAAGLNSESAVSSAGTGFVLREDGYILTNAHVVQDAMAILVTLHDGQQLRARLVASEALGSDLALLKVDPPRQLQKVLLGDSDKLQVGDPVYTIGHPLGELSFSLTSGYVSAAARSIRNGDSSISMLQTNAAINHGNSGGPLFDAQGRVVAIVTAKYSGRETDAALEGLGFAIPINDAMALAESWMEQATTGNKQ